MPKEVISRLDANEQAPLLALLQDMLAIPALEIKATLDHAGQLIGQTFGADKVDILLYEESTQTLVAVGTSDTPMAQRERAIGMDRLPLANGGRVVEVFQTGTPYLNGHVEADLGVLPGFREGLGIRSMVAMPLMVQGLRRGCVTLSSAAMEQFHERQLPVVAAVAHWLGLVLHHAELVERLTAEAAERARRATAEELITVMAHDIKNYVQPITAGVELLLRRALREERTNDVHTSQRVMMALGRLRRVIDDLLDVSRLETGLFRITPERMNMTELVVRTAGALTTPQQPITVRTYEELYLQADPNRIRQALENLVANAQRYAPAGVPVLVELSTTQKQGVPWIVIHVRDEGPGIEPDVLPRLFTRYGGGKGSVGLGLGLYLAQQIASAHGGSISATSAPNEGTSFVFMIPWNE